ncbi:MAG TPA: hypothetical protein DCS29_04410 [Candidatus Magasanikbacteria bacterium]|nr:MAG: hypothetical protein A2479_03465 [Candidatus Magasanikbacteria bacterium RIFOXYC2_FULL_39_8]HAT03984.1 hypothetical protein [Candidatus Magasanikbacteria bacterium]
MVFATVLCWISWVFVISNVDPFQTTMLGFVFFYASLYLALLGTISLVIFFCYKLFASRDLPLFRYVQISSRQSLFISTFLVICLYLQGQQYLNIWNALLLMAIFILFISFSLSVKHGSKQTHAPTEGHN